MTVSQVLKKKKEEESSPSPPPLLLPDNILKACDQQHSSKQHTEKTLCPHL